MNRVLTAVDELSETQNPLSQREINGILVTGDSRTFPRPAAIIRNQITIHFPLTEELFGPDIIFPAHNS